MHGEGEREKRIYVAVTCTRTQMLSRTLALDLGLSTLPAAGGDRERPLHCLTTFPGLDACDQCCAQAPTPPWSSCEAAKNWR